MVREQPPLSGTRENPTEQQRPSRVKNKQINKIKILKNDKFIFVVNGHKGQFFFFFFLRVGDREEKGKQEFGMWNL